MTTLEDKMRISILLAIVAVVLTGVPAESFADGAAPQRQVKRLDNRSATVVSAPRQQVKKLLTSTPAYRPL